MRKLTFLICLVICLGLFVSCKKEETVKLTIIYNKGVENEIIEVKKGKTATIPTQKQIEHGTLVGYTYEDGTIFSFDTIINKDLTIYAKWDMEDVTCTFFDYDRKTIIETKTLDYGSPLIYPENPSDKIFDGYKLVFDKWNKTIDIITSDIAIYAIYKEVYEKVNVNIKNSDGEIIDVVELDYSDYIDEPELPILNKQEDMYYQFLGWYDEETNELFDFNQKITKEVTIIPKYKVGKIKKLSLEESTISILGDSISTFYSPSSSVNSFYSGDNQFYYPRYSQTVKEVSSTWWYQTYTSLGVKLGINNSLSGSAAYGVGSTAGESSSRLSTLDDNGIPNIIIIFLGTNDNVNGHTTENLKSAYEKIIAYINENFVQEINNEFIIPEIYIFNNGYSGYTGYNYTETRRLEYNEMFKNLSLTYNNVNLFDLASLITNQNYQTYLGDNLHYNSAGMALISENLVKQIKNNNK